MNAEKMLGTLFRAIDGKDADAFAALLAPDGEFRFGNLPPVCGRNAVREFVAGFFASIAALTHVVETSWQGGDDLICHGRVSYSRHHGLKFYFLTDGTSELYVSTKKAVPNKGDEVTVTGKVSQLLKIGNEQVVGIEEQKGK